MPDDNKSPLRWPRYRWTTPENGLNPADEKSISAYRQLKTKYYTLVEKHNRRRRWPLQFVDAFRNFQDAITKSPDWVWPQVAEEVEHMRRFGATLKPHYEKCRKPAIAQKLQKLETSKHAVHYYRLRFP